LFLSREEKLEAKGLDNLINKESGLKGLSGLSSDMREVMEAAKKGDMKALLAVQVFCYRIKKYIGAYFAALGGVDVLVFTGGIGQGSVEVRARVCQGLQHMGIILNEERNRSPEPSADGISRVSGDESKVPVLVVPTDEELMIARETVRALQFCEAKERIRKQDRIPIPVATVGKYARLSANDRDFLFGPDYGLRPRFKLSQPGEFLAEECVTLVGRKNTIATVPILLPMAAESEISLSQQEEFILGIDAPVRISGDIDGTPGITLEGPMGRVTIDRGVIQHRRHLHIAPEDALKLDLKHHDLVSMEIQGKASARLDDVVVEIAPGANLELHIDDFEAQSLDISAESIAFIDGVYERKF
jgi:acetate kinase